MSSRTCYTKIFKWLMFLQLLLSFFGGGNIAAVEKLKAEIKLLSSRVSIDKPLHVEFVFKNISEELVRLYFIESAVFNVFQNDIFVKAKSGNKCQLIRELFPHGYTVTEKEFYLMKPKTSLTFRQEITYDFDCIDDFLDKPVYIEWVYENSIDTWKGGYETLDGIAKTLFDGEKIPNIFVGRLVATSGEARFVSEKGKALQNN